MCRENKEKVDGVGWNTEKYDTGGGLRPRTARPGTCRREKAWISSHGCKDPSLPNSCLGGCPSFLLLLLGWRLCPSAKVKCSIKSSWRKDKLHKCSRGRGLSPWPGRGLRGGPSGTAAGQWEGRQGLLNGAWFKCSGRSSLPTGSLCHGSHSLSRTSSSPLAKALPLLHHL